MQIRLHYLSRDDKFPLYIIFSTISLISDKINSFFNSYWDKMVKELIKLRPELCYI